MTSGHSSDARGVAIAGLGHAVPDRVVTSAKLEAELDLAPGWIAERTGILERRWVSDGETLSGLATNAGAAALLGAQQTTACDLTAADIGMLFLATSTPDHLLPPTAPRVAYDLGLANSGGIDMAGACPGFLYALMAADAYVRTHNRAALVIAANILSRRINMIDRSSAILFADAAGAVVLTPSANPRQGLIGADFRTDASAYDLLKIEAGGSTRPFAADTDISDTRMVMRDGRRVFTAAVDMMAETTRVACSNAGAYVDDMSRIIPHQANARIVTAVTNRIGARVERVGTSYEHFGNASAATIPLTLSRGAKQTPLQAREVLLMTAAGAGLNAGSVVWRV